MDLERELETFSLNCSKCGLDVHWVSGLANTTSSSTPSTSSPSRAAKPTTSSTRRWRSGAAAPTACHPCQDAAPGLLKVKADLERELEDFVLNCSKCGLDVHWVSGLGVTLGSW